MHEFTDVLSNSWVGFLLLVGAGYLAGLLLTTLSVLWSLLIGLVIRIAFRTRAANFRHASRNDEIAAADKDAGVTIAKMQAEATLCQNLLSAFVVLIFANDTGAFTVSALMGHGTGCRWTVFFVLLVAAVFRTVVYLERQNSLYSIHVSKTAYPRNGRA